MTYNKGITTTAFLRGGLGNQCFIYAAGRTLADVNGSAFHLDSSYFQVDRVYARKYLLGSFNIRVDRLTEPSVIPLVRARQVRYKIMSAYHLRWPGLFCENRPCRFEEDVKKHQGGATLDGYWQSERYFEDNAASVYTDLQFKEGNAFAQEDILSTIRACDNSVFVHARSYTDIPGKADYSQALPVSYYKNAFHFLSSRLREYSLFIFSDDPEWAKSHIPVPIGKKAHYIVQTGNNSDRNTLRDFYLMQQCQHGIAANSSFSWWANWLGERTQDLAGRNSIRICYDKPFINADYWPARWQGISDT